MTGPDPIIVAAIKSAVEKAINVVGKNRLTSEEFFGINQKN